MTIEEMKDYIIREGILESVANEMTDEQVKKCYLALLSMSGWD